jgi:hypothetical protein
MEELSWQSPASSADDWTTDQKQKWRELAKTWHDAPAPASPSADDLKTFVGLAERYVRPDGAIAITGCTPSLRAALCASDALSAVRVYCVDFTTEMWNVTTATLDQRHPHEQFIESSWFDLADALPESVDVVLGDKPLDNVEFSRWPAIFEAIHGALKPAGHLVVHVGLVIRDPAPIDAAALARRWADELRSGAVSTSDAASGLWEDLLTGSVCGGRLPDPHRLTIAVFRDELEACRTHAPADSAEATLLDRFQELFGASLEDSWTAFTFDDLLRVAGVRFVPREARWSGDYAIAHLQPIVDFEARTNP